MNVDAEREANDNSWEQQADAERHREMDLDEALSECEKKGVSRDSLMTLVFETGARWKPNADRSAG